MSSVDPEYEEKEKEDTLLLRKSMKAMTCKFFTTKEN